MTFNVAEKPLRILFGNQIILREPTLEEARYIALELQDTEWTPWTSYTPIECTCHSEFVRGIVFRAGENYIIHPDDSSTIALNEANLTIGDAIRTWLHHITCSLQINLSFGSARPY